MSNLASGEKPRREFSEEEKTEMVRLRSIGKTPLELAEKYHTQTFRIHQILNSCQAGLDLKKAKREKTKLKLQARRERKHPQEKQ